MAYTQQQVARLQEERTNDPHGRGYSGMDDNQFLTSVNLADIPVERTDITTQEIFEQYVGADLPAREMEQQHQCARPLQQPITGPARDLILGLLLLGLRGFVLYPCSFIGGAGFCFMPVFFYSGNWSFVNASYL